jgi:Holliday junction resolvase
VNSRRKGKVGEREFAALLREHGFDARRGQQFSGSPDSPDVVSDALAWLHVEVKRVQNLNLTDACVQAEGDCGGKPWVVAHRRNHAPWLITMRAETFFQFLREELPLQGNAPVAQSPQHEREINNNETAQTKE